MGSEISILIASEGCYFKTEMGAHRELYIVIPRALFIASATTRPTGSLKIRDLRYNNNVIESASSKEYRPGCRVMSNDKVFARYEGPGCPEWSRCHAGEPPKNRKLLATLIPGHHKPIDSPRRCSYSRHWKACICVEIHFQHSRNQNLTCSWLENHRSSASGNFPAATRKEYEPQTWKHGSSVCPNVDGQ